MTAAQQLQRTDGRDDRVRATALAAWLRAQAGTGALLTADSRAVRAGDAFVACPGLRSDGRDFIEAALGAGARAVLWDADGGARDAAIAARVAAAGAAGQPVTGLRALAGEIASTFCGDPSRQLELVAVTGTNGKTSCTQWLAQGAEADGEPAAVIGTLGSGRIGALDPFGLTTPDAVSLHRMLAGFVAEGVRHTAIEASSIGLHQGRLDGASVAAAVFTNLTHDHLDYHGEMDAYAAAKGLLFARLGLRTAVVNLNDPAAAAMLDALAAGQSPAARRIGYTLGAPVVEATRVDARLVAESIETRPDGMTLTLAGDFGRARVALNLIGRFNAANALAVAATWLGLGLPLDRVCERLARLRPVRGRLEAVPAGAGAPLVVVDYAHTPDALVNVLGALRDVADARGGRLWCLFGAGGDRDPSKRPVMARAAEAAADVVVVTSDNPRSESPAAILRDIVAGLTRPAHAVTEDRGAAIADAVLAADAADVVLLAGKGHETYQEIAGRRLPFDDAEQARAALARRMEVVR